MNDLCILIAVNVIKGFVFLYDIVTYIPRYVIEQPYKKLALSGRLRVSTSSVYFFIILHTWHTFVLHLFVLHLALAAS